MKLTVKTLKGEIINIEISETATVLLFLPRFTISKLKFMLRRVWKSRPKKLCLREKPQITQIHLKP